MIAFPASASLLYSSKKLLFYSFNISCLQSFNSNFRARLCFFSGFFSFHPVSCGGNSDPFPRTAPGKICKSSFFNCKQRFYENCQQVINNQHHSPAGTYQLLCTQMENMQVQNENLFKFIFRFFSFLHLTKHWTFILPSDSGCRRSVSPGRKIIFRDSISRCRISAFLPVHGGRRTVIFHCRTGRPDKAIAGRLLPNPSHTA